MSNGAAAFSCDAHLDWLIVKRMLKGMIGSDPAVNETAEHGEHRAQAGRSVSGSRPRQSKSDSGV